MAIKEIFPYAGNGDGATFRAAETLTPGEYVKMTSTGIAQADAGEAYIGQVEFNNAHVAIKERITYLDDEMVPVKLNAPARQVIAMGVIAVGNYVKMTTGGRVIVEATATTKTLATVGIAIIASAADDDVISIVPAY